MKPETYQKLCAAMAHEILKSAATAIIDAGFKSGKFKTPEDAVINLCPNRKSWNPFMDGGEALRLAVELHMSIEVSDDGHEVYVASPAGNHWTSLCGDDPLSATCGAITRVAALMGGWKP